MKRPSEIYDQIGRRVEGKTCANCRFLLQTAKGMQCGIRWFDDENEWWIPNREHGEPYPIWYSEHGETYHVWCDKYGDIGCLAWEPRPIFYETESDIEKSIKEKQEYLHKLLEAVFLEAVLDKELSVNYWKTNIDHTSPIIDIIKQFFDDNILGQPRDEWLLEAALEGTLWNERRIK